MISMRCLARVALVSILAASWTGCGSGNGGGEAAYNGPGPDVTVFNFLEAVRTGNEETTAGMLTPMAREKVKEYGWTIAPTGSETAAFEVGEIDQHDEWVTHVASTWTDLNEQGQPETETIVWILRREEEGWRIGGMGTKLFDGEPPLFFNFEDPEDMERKQKLAEQEIERRMRAAQGGGQPAGDRPAVGTGPAAEGKPATGPVLQASRTEPVEDTQRK